MQIHERTKTINFNKTDLCLQEERVYSGLNNLTLIIHDKGMIATNTKLKYNN